MACTSSEAEQQMSLEETFGNLAAFLNSLDAEGEQKFELSHSLVIICPDCGKNIAFRNRCPKCGDFMRQHVLWFDEFYGEHEHYQWNRVLAAAASFDAVLFVGTSFAVGVTDLVSSSAIERRSPAIGPFSAYARERFT